MAEPFAWLPREPRTAPPPTHHHPTETDPQAVVACACGLPASQFHMLDCDDCHRWFHCSCVGMQSRSTAPRVPWRCYECVHAPTPDNEPQTQRLVELAAIAWELSVWQDLQSLCRSSEVCHSMRMALLPWLMPQKKKRLRALCAALGAHSTASLRAVTGLRCGNPVGYGDNSPRLAKLDASDGTLLFSCRPPLRILRLDGAVDDSSCVALLRSLITTRLRLKELSLSSCALTHTAVEQLAASFEAGAFPQLNELWLQNNDLSNEDIVALGKATTLSVRQARLDVHVEGNLYNSGVIDILQIALCAQAAQVRFHLRVSSDPFTWHRLRVHFSRQHPYYMRLTLPVPSAALPQTAAEAHAANDAALMEQRQAEEEQAVLAARAAELEEVVRKAREAANAALGRLEVSKRRVECAQAEALATSRQLQLGGPVVGLRPFADAANSESGTITPERNFAPISIFDDDVWLPEFNMAPPLIAAAAAAAAANPLAGFNW